MARRRDKKRRNHDGETSKKARGLMLCRSASVLLDGYFQVHTGGAADGFLGFQAGGGLGYMERRGRTHLSGILRSPKKKKSECWKSKQEC